MAIDIYKKLTDGWYCCPPLGDGDDPGGDDGVGGDGDASTSTTDDGTGTGDDDPVKDSPYTEEELKILSGQSTTADDDTGVDDDNSSTGDGDDDNDDPTQTPAPWETEIAELKKTIEELRTSKGKEEPSADSDQAKPPASKDPRQAKVEYEDPKNPFHGMTLGQIYDINPDEAYAISPRLANQIYINDREAEQSKRVERDNALAQVEQETQAFCDEYSKLELGKGFSELDAKGKAAVTHKAELVKQWMLEQNKFGITISDAYFLMDRETILAKAASKATDKVIKAATSGKVTTIKTKKDDAATTDSDDMTTWDSAKMSRHIDSLDGPAYTKFLKTATKAVREKFPSFPWA